MTRLEQFRKLQSHPLLGRDFLKLKKAEIIECEAFLAVNENLSRDEFALKVNRWLMDQPERRTKNYSIMWALVSQSNQAI